ncbi:MAG TPA: hypothetical protein PK263_01540, partial [bacterium]|nr:hypothetical protein [bacterium]
MKKKRVIIKSSIKYLLLATIMFSVLSFSPVSLNYAGPSVALAQSSSAVRIKTEDHKEIQSRYRDSLHTVKT